MKINPGAVFCVLLFVSSAFAQDVPPGSTPLYTYRLAAQGTVAAYDEAVAVACLQGLINRDGPRLYVLAAFNGRPQYWLDLFSRDSRWLAGRERIAVPDLDGLRKLAGGALKGAVVWDPAVPATLNAATTIAGVEDGVVLSPELAEALLPAWGLPVLVDLRGRFDGNETGSAKNDVYRWAIREYVATGRCSSHFVCLFEDSASARAAGSVSYVVTRDWAVTHRAFVFDLSPWGDEAPKDDPGQALGTDLATYRQLLEAVMTQAAGRHMTEITGFFAFWKYSNIPGFASSHEPVPTEWESVYVMSPYNCYQNTVSSDCYNQSLHRHAPFTALRQRRPVMRTAVEDKAYVCILMADYDSTTPLYDFLPKFWDDPVRGELPLAWGINPNLIETYPDVIAHLYATATPNDHFTSDASAAGYFNPNRVKPDQLPLFVAHNKRFFEMTNMTIAPMVLDWEEPTAAVKDAFTQFAPDGYATIVMDMHGKGGKTPAAHVWKGMPVLELINNTCNFVSPKQTSDAIVGAIRGRGGERPGFYFFRIVWTPPSAVRDSLAVLRAEHPELGIEVLDPYNFMGLFRQSAGS
ncbi:MAG: hypothetical protein HYV27_20715 [Candidatus Hydrogenedentes bacterium]|nr:hypothetical protein [Candidatus Hydrogenedentota bacterium]